MIAVCQNVAMSAEDKLLMRPQLRKHKILMKVFPNQVGSGPSFPALFPTRSTPMSDCSISPKKWNSQLPSMAAL